MATVTEGSNGTYTFTSSDSVQFDVDPGEVVNVQVFSSAGDRVFASPLYRTQIIGPFSPGSVMTVTAARGDAVYTVVDQENFGSPAYLPPGAVSSVGLNSSGQFVGPSGVIGVTPTKRTGRSAFQTRPGVSTRMAANSSAALNVSQKGGFRACRVVVRNYDTAAVMNVTAKAAAAPTANPTGAGLTPVNITWGVNPSTGARLLTKQIPAASIVPNTSSQIAPAAVCSDWVALDGVARTDVVGADPVIHVRLTSPEGLYYDSMNLTASMPSALGRSVSTAFSSGTDTVTGWSNMSIQNSQFAVLPDVQIEFLSNSRTASIAVFADSLAAGVDPTINYILSAQAKLFSAGVAAGIASYALGGQKIQTTAATLQAVLSVQKPDIVLIHDYTVNSAASPAITADEQFQYLLQNIDAIKAVGAKPVIVTMHSNGTYTQRTRAAFAGIYDIVDMAAILSDGASGIKDEYCANSVSDRTHISALGADLVATRLAEVLVNLIPAT